MHQFDKIWEFENSYLNLPSPFYSDLSPTTVSSPSLLLLNNNLAHDLGLKSLISESKYLTSVFSGNYVPKQTISFAQAYGGHQFGHFNILGDGRAVVLGELADRSKRMRQKINKNEPPIFSQKEK